MKSFSDKTVSKEQLDQARNELNEQHQSLITTWLTPTKRKVRWLVGLGVFNLIASTLALIIALYKN